MEIEPRLSVGQLAKLWGCSRRTCALIERLLCRSDRPAWTATGSSGTGPANAASEGVDRMPSPAEDAAITYMVGRRQRTPDFVPGEIASEARRFLAEFIAAWKHRSHSAPCARNQILDGYLLDRTARFGDSIRYDTATAEPVFCIAAIATTLNRCAPMGGLGGKRVGGAAAVHRKKRRELSDGTLIRELVRSGPRSRGPSGRDGLRQRP
jgi:hypothetical protein